MCEPNVLSAEQQLKQLLSQIELRDKLMPCLRAEMATLDRHLEMTDPREQLALSEKLVRCLREYFRAEVTPLDQALRQEMALRLELEWRLAAGGGMNGRAVNPPPPVLPTTGLRIVYENLV